MDSVIGICQAEVCWIQSWQGCPQHGGSEETGKGKANRDFETCAPMVAGQEVMSEVGKWGILKNVKEFKPQFIATFL